MDLRGGDWGGGEMRIARMSALITAMAVAFAARADLEVTLDLNATPIKDQSLSRSAPDFGYAGGITDAGGDCFDEFILRHPDETWELCRKAGAYVVKEWGANGRWAKATAYANLATEEERAKFRKENPQSIHADPKVYFDWRKKHGVKVLLCLELGGDDIGVSRRNILDYVRWIVDNGYTDQVIGFELGNEPYWGGEPEFYAARWAEIVPDIKRIWPEAQIGFAIAEYRDGDPDIAAVRARSTRVDEWFSKSSEFGFNRINQWSGRFVVAFSNCLDLCSHVIYHFYGGDGSYGCSSSGFTRIRNFAKIFPEVKDKKVWITEWRERSDEDLICQQTFASALFKSHYMIACLCQPEIEAICCHQITVLSGGFYLADGRGTWTQPSTFWKVDWRTDDLDYTGRPRLEVGPSGPAFRLMAEAVLRHPVVMEHGTFSKVRRDYWMGSSYYGHQGAVRHWVRWGADPAKHPVKNRMEWALLVNKDRSSAAFLVANSSSEVWKPRLKVPGRCLGKAHYRVYRCRSEEETVLFMIPGEPFPFYEEEYDGDSTSIEVPPCAIAEVSIPLVKEAK